MYKYGSKGNDEQTNGATQLGMETSGDHRLIRNVRNDALAYDLWAIAL